MLASADPLAFAVKGMELDFIRPAKIDEALVVKSRLENTRGASVTLVQNVEREGDILVTAQVRVAIIGQDLRPRRIPLEMRRHFEAIKSSHGIGEESPL
jgi:acyl-CoA thioester hydrolase